MTGFSKIYKSVIISGSKDRKHVERKGLNDQTEPDESRQSCPTSGVSPRGVHLYKYFSRSVRTVFAPITKLLIGRAHRPTASYVMVAQVPVVRKTSKGISVGAG